MEGFEQWLEQQHARAAPAMLRSLSPVGVVKQRPGFGQTIRPVRGAIVASPVLAAYDPDPDYFFHWHRDSAVVIDAVRLLCEAGATLEGSAHFADFVRFALALRSLDGRELVETPSWRSRVAKDFHPFVREDSDLAAVHGDAVAADTRVNADGTLDISRWARPQNDGPALRALAVLRWMRDGSMDASVSADAKELLRSDLDFAFTHARRPCFDIWEEEHGLHYYTLCVSAAALEAGADWLESARETTHQAHAYRTEAAEVRRTLDGFWLPDAGYYRSRVLSSGERSAKELDIAVILASIHAGGAGETHSVRDPRMHATLSRLEGLFDAAYPINHRRPAGTSPAMGRYAGDVYYSGGAYYFSTLGAGEFCYRAAAAGDSAQWLRRGDGYLATVQAFTPASGEMSEQFDQRTGAQTSAKELAWSYAAFISCLAARRAALARA
jgi:glucoamylase